MRWRELSEDGRIVKGVNTTVDVDTNEIKVQAAKFGNTVDKDGRPQNHPKKTKGSSTNVLFNLGLAEGYKLQLERDRELLVLNITDTKTGKRTEVRGKPGYETDYDPNDKLHMLLDKVGKSANISELMNGEVVTINPKHPDADRAKAATDVAYNESKSADLYHSTHDDESFASILKSGAIKPNFDHEHTTEKDPRPYISLSRDKRFDMFGSLPITLVIDQTKLANSHKITPYDSFAGDDDFDKRSSGSSEAEERVYKPIPISYIKYVILRNTNWIDSEAVLAAAKAANIPVVDLKGNRLDENFAEDKEIGIHRSSEDFAVIDLSKSADGTFWLNGVDNTDWDSTVTTGQGVDMAFEISPQAKLASYDDIDKYSIAELENMGYDGVRMVDGDNIAYQIWNTKILKRTKLGENFADGKKKGKSRPGRVKRSGASCNGSVTDLRKRAKNASGEKAKMYHWCANMKSGRKKK